MKMKFRCTARNNFPALQSLELPEEDEEGKSALSLPLLVIDDCSNSNPISTFIPPAQRQWRMKEIFFQSSLRSLARFDVGGKAR
jgi:hypothetical protein